MQDKGPGWETDLKKRKGTIIPYKSYNAFPSNSLANVSVWQIRMSVSPIGKLVWVTQNWILCNIGSVSVWV